MTQVNPYTQGYAAGYDYATTGIAPYPNPHPSYTSDYEEWEDGFSDGYFAGQN